MKQWKKWEMALLLGLCAALIWGAWAAQRQDALARKMIRLHVIANSDSPADQALKLAVRDRVLEQAQALYPAGADLDTAREALEGSLSRLAAAGRQEVERQGYAYPVTARLVRCHFPTKEYGGFALPAGEYTALRVVIGQGEGRNWWCVAFPPLCLGAASETVDDAVSAGLFTTDQGALMTRDGEGYVLRLYENRGLEVEAELRLALSAEQIRLADALEREGEELSIADGKLRLHFRPHEIKTLSLRGVK